ncbi:sodium-dependent transporter, partial [Bermanella marisrubri]
MAHAHFTSKLGFIAAAAGSAVGLGNIWGFPTEAANNGGGTFLLIYFAMVVLVGYPMLLAEVTIGNLAQANPIDALSRLTQKAKSRIVLAGIGWAGTLTILLILSFYSVVGAWIMNAVIQQVNSLLNIAMPSIPLWLSAYGFLALTACVIVLGVKNGIERLSKILMPTLLLLLIIMIIWVLTLDGASKGISWYFTSDFSQLSPELLGRALGQAFFSLSIGVTGMMTYGAYLKRSRGLPKTVASVTLLDTSVAFLAGLLILPALSAAQAQGITVFNGAGQLIGSDKLVFDILPALFANLGVTGLLISILFFVLLLIAAITSSISMMEPPVNTLQEKTGLNRKACLIAVTAVAALVIG